MRHRGIETTAADFYIHVCHGEGRVYRYPVWIVKQLLNQLKTVETPTSKGVLIPIDTSKWWLKDCCIIDQIPRSGNTDHDGKMAEYAVYDAIIDGRISWPGFNFFCVERVTDRDRQLSGLDLVFVSSRGRTRLGIDVKLDRRAEVTGNLYCETHERRG